MLCDVSCDYGHMPLYCPRNKKNKKNKKENQIKENKWKEKKIKINIRVQAYHDTMNIEDNIQRGCQINQFISSNKSSQREIFTKFQILLMDYAEWMEA